MAVYPTSLPTPSIASEEAMRIPIKKTEKEGNYIQVRRTATRSRMKFTLQYNLLTYSEYSILETFFSTYQGTSFSWTHPVSAIVYNVVFDMEELKRKLYSTYCTATVILTEL